MWGPSAERVAADPAPVVVSRWRPRRATSARHARGRAAMAHLFAKTRLLESKIDEYLDHTSEVGLLFLEAIKD